VERSPFRASVPHGDRDPATNRYGGSTYEYTW